MVSIMLGLLEPETASDIAKQYGIKVYTLELEPMVMAEFPYAIAPNGQFLFQMMQVEIDEQLMKAILLKKRDGNYFRATSNKQIRTEIYESINKLETTEIEELKVFMITMKNTDLLFGWQVFVSC